MAWRAPKRRDTENSIVGEEDDSVVSDRGRYLWAGKEMKTDEQIHVLMEREGACGTRNWWRLVLRFGCISHRR